MNPRIAFFAFDSHEKYLKVHKLSQCTSNELRVVLSAIGDLVVICNRIVVTLAVPNQVSMPTEPKFSISAIRALKGTIFFGSCILTAFSVAKRTK